MSKKLTNKQKKFCESYVAHGNAVKAVRDAGYKTKTYSTAGSIGSENLQKLEIQDYIKELQDDSKARTGKDADWVREQLVRVIEKSSQAVPVMIRVGGELVESGEYKYDSAGVAKALDILNRMSGNYEKDNAQSSTQLVVQASF